MLVKPLSRGVFRFSDIQALDLSLKTRPQSGDPLGGDLDHVDPVWLQIVGGHTYPDVAIQQSLSSSDSAS